MRILVIHDVQGNIYHFAAVNPPDSPPATVQTEPGLLATEVEAPELAEIDLLEPESRHHLVEISEHFQVERAEARLVRKGSEAQ